MLDDCSREALRIEIDTSLPAARVIRALNELIEVRGKPRRLRLDNGPELISHALAQWARDNLIELCFIQPGKPTQNALIERFNRTFVDRGGQPASGVYAEQAGPPVGLGLISAP